MTVGHNPVAAAWRARNKDKIQAYEDSRRDRRKSYKAENYQKAKQSLPFVGVDGEGRDVPDAGHAYFMLRAGDDTRVATGESDRLSTLECLEFLSDLPSGNLYCAYFFDYDVSKILADLPWHKLDRLVHRERRVAQNGGYWPVDWEGYEIDWFPGKEFKVRAEGGDWVYINDVGSFFQTSFVKALELWDIGTPRQREMIAEGKNLRADFAQVDDTYVDEYNRLECVLLALLMEKFRKVCENIGYVPRKWQGPGQLAEAAMVKHDIPFTVDLEILNATDNDAYSLSNFGRYAYYGPKFETTTVGYADIPTIQYDINSAFPAAMLHLPCLVHGTWERHIGKRRLETDELSISFGAFRPKGDGKRSVLMGFPIRRKDGSIHFPFSGKGWYWSFEARSAIHQSFDVYDSWVYTKHCDCRWFDFITELYAARKKWGKDTMGLVIKLLLNSLYGKLVQSIGNPRFSNPIWASFITAWTRTMIADAIHSLPCCKSPDPKVPCGYDVSMIASDAIYTRDYDNVTIDVGNELGQWSRDVHKDGLFIVQPGVYFSLGEDTDTEPVFKTRGVSKRLVIEHKQDFLDGFQRLLATRRVQSGDVYLPARPFVGIRLAVQRRTLRQLGQFIPFVDTETGRQGRRTSFEWTSKRRPQPLPDYMGGISELRGIRTMPYRGTENEYPQGAPVQTVPYSKDIGGIKRREIERMAFEGQPDWVRVQ